MAQRDNATEPYLDLLLLQGLLVHLSWDVARVTIDQFRHWALQTG